MTHRERVLKTFRFEQPDRLAYDLLEGTVWRELLDYFRVERNLAERLEVQDFLDTDFRWVKMSSGLFGSRSESDHTIYTNEVAHGPLAEAETVSEVESYNWPDPSRWSAPNWQEARAQWPDHALVLFAGWSPLFWKTCEVFGVEAALVNLVSRSKLFECAVRCNHERYMERLKRGLMAARGFCDICWLGDDFASQQSMLLSPEHWRRFIKPALAEQVELARSHDMYVLYHSCGAVRPVLPDLIEIGINGLLVFQTTAREMDAGSIARDFGGRMVFYGGMDVQHLLSFGTPEEVKAEVLTNAQAFSKCGGYVVANSHHGVATIRGKNIEAMCQAARKTVS
ncbi:uroporphyrinogen decarboxylase family protein [Candidatus Hydrogenedentota bacterium]